MVALAEAEGSHELADGFAVARGYLFRAPSEMVPVSRSSFRVSRSSGVVFSSADVVVTLSRRKNRTAPVDLKRTCVCDSQGRRLCCYHHLRRAVDRARAAKRLRVFSFSYEQILAATRRLALQVGVQDASTHAFRRSMAQDMAAQGCQLYEILRAGGWRSSSFIDYMKPHELEAGACAQLIAEHRDSDVDVPS